MAIHELRAKRATIFDAYKALGEKADFDEAKDAPNFKKLGDDLASADAEIARAQAIQDAGRDKAVPAPGQDEQAHKTYAVTKSDIYTHQAAAEARGLLTNKGLTFGGMARMLALGNGNPEAGRRVAAKLYGERHPVTEGFDTAEKALIAGVGASGGFIVPPEYINEIIEILRPMTVVRSAGPRTMPMPRGTMTLPAQTAAAVASYSGETSAISQTQQQLGQIIASYKKLTALTPISNDLMRFADPAADAFVRDDLTKVIALREDLAFIMGDGTQFTPRGFLSFAIEYALQQGGIAGTYLTSGASTASSGGNFITSTAVYTLATVASELGGMVNKLDTANVPDNRRCWFMHPRSYNYLFNVQNSLGLYVYRDELMTGKLLTYPVKRTTQIPINIDDTGSNTTCSFVFLVEMTDALVLDSMTMGLFVSREGSYVASNGATISLVQNDQTLIRAIAEHDFQMRHSASIAVNQFVLWAPAIS